MKKLSFILLLVFLQGESIAQTNRVIGFFPQGTILHGNLPYVKDNHEKQLVDLYLPPHAKGKLPLVIFIHGGGWLVNDKYADMGYMKKTVAEIVGSGFALASIDYRYATQAIFPAQIQDCNSAVAFLVANAGKYNLDINRIGIMGFSAGGHLASLLGLSDNNKIKDFAAGSKPFNFKCVVDFYGPAELLLFPGNNDPKSPESQLIGATPLDRPDLAKAASPVSYVDKSDPPFLIIHGEKDDMVSPKQSQLLSSWLNLSGVKHELIIVKDAPHYGEMFDRDEVRNKVLAFLKMHLRSL